MPDSKALVRFEEKSDAAVQALGIWNLPVRSILSSLYLTVDVAFSGGREYRKAGRNPGTGGKVLSNLSYLTDFLKKCPRDIRANIDDALSVMSREAQADLVKAVGYTSLSEIMPAVHRGYFDVEVTADGHFKLAHPNRDIQRAEERDIAMAELMLAFENQAPPYSSGLFDKLIDAWPMLPGDVLAPAFVRSRDHYLNALREAPHLPEDAYRTAFGFSREDFLRARVGLMTVGDFANGRCGRETS